MDLQAALSVADHFARIARRALMFGHTRDQILEELIAAGENYTRVAQHIELQMEEELV